VRFTVFRNIEMVLRIQKLPQADFIK